MAWFGGKVSLGNFPDLVGAVNKLQESVKSIEKNFDSALGLEGTTESGAAPSSEASSGLWPVMSFMGSRSDDISSEPMASSGSPQKNLIETGEEIPSNFPTAENGEEDQYEHSDVPDEDEISESTKHLDESLKDPIPIGNVNDDVNDSSVADTLDLPQQNDAQVIVPIQSVEPVEPQTAKSEACDADQSDAAIRMPDDTIDVVDMAGSISKQGTTDEESLERSVRNVKDNSSDQTSQGSDFHHNMGTFVKGLENESNDSPTVTNVKKDPELSDNDVNFTIVGDSSQFPADKVVTGSQFISAEINTSEPANFMYEIGNLRTELKTMETALQGAARQAQLKADEIAKLMNDNEHLRALIEDLKKKSNHDAEIESLREEYHQRVSNLERKLYALTKERDTLRREQSKKSDAAALLKEKDEIINQVMAEGEELSKKQAAQESTIRKLRAQVRELEEEKKGLSTKLQVEENKVESIKKDKAATEKLLQETIERHQNELAVQKEYYEDALTAAKEAEALAEVRANNEARSELESRLRETEERESLLVQALEELRQTLSRKEQQAVFREDMLHRDIEDLQQRYQASERRCEELVTQVPESTRPLLRQIEAMQETAARRAEAWAAVERSLNSRLQEAETRAAASEEKERSINERLSQTLSRVNVLEAQISCLRAEQTQLSKSLEKERQRAAENRQEYLAVKEEAETQEGRAVQLEIELKELRQKHKLELQDAQVHKELLQQEVEKEKAARVELERTSRSHSAVFDQVSPANLSRKLSGSSSVGNVEESFFLQSSLDVSENYIEKKILGEANLSPYYMKSLTPSTFESALRQKDGELASYMSRLASMESIRDSLAEELVKLTEQCERLRSESALLPGIRAELEALRRRHSAALELMGERDEELEELRADVIDLKEMYREQVNLLVNKLQIMSPSQSTS